jgi:hypothetical protein
MRNALRFRRSGLLERRGNTVKTCFRRGKQTQNKLGGRSRIRLVPGWRAEGTEIADGKSGIPMCDLHGGGRGTRPPYSL